jgi:exopolyphosphatase/guanosine-5'-triphosphate,3'-diphosphate pyrophosphatase
MSARAVVASARKPLGTTGLAFWMQRVLEECAHASVAFAPDPVHDLRVALRRCRSIADGLRALDPDLSWKQMKKAAKRLFDRLGELRDVQVMEEWVARLGGLDDPVTLALLQFLAGRESQLKQEAAQALIQFDEKRWQGWAASLPRRAARMRLGSPIFQHLALERWTAAYELHHRALRNRSQVAFHQLRIGLKRFRYIVENFLPTQHAAWSDDLKKLQDVLGEVHDLDVLWATALQVNAFPDAEARSRWHSKTLEERSRRIEVYREKMLGKGSLWVTWRSQLPQSGQVEAIALNRIRLWGSLLDPDFKHSQHVARLALQLYDGLPATPGSESREDRTVLQLAALLHDVGVSRKNKSHHKTSQKLIARLNPPLGWNPENMKMVAAVARYHRGALPRAGQKSLAGLTMTQRQTAIKLAAVLRLANAFDADRDGRIERLACERQNGYLLIRAQSYDPRDRLAETIAGSRHLLETVYHKPIMVKPLTVRKTRVAA